VFLSRHTSAPTTGVEEVLIIHGQKKRGATQSGAEKLKKFTTQNWQAFWAEK
jgi:hypothetical protein